MMKTGFETHCYILHYLAMMNNKCIGPDYKYYCIHTFVLHVYCF